MRVRFGFVVIKVERAPNAMIVLLLEGAIRSTLLVPVVGCGAWAYAAKPHTPPSA
jgi:hypothetical protein